MKETISIKYALAPENIENISLNPKDGKYFQVIYDFVILRKIENDQIRSDKYNLKIDKTKKALRSPLNLTKKVMLLAERLRKKDAPGRLYKSSTENMPFFNRNNFYFF